MDVNTELSTRFSSIEQIISHIAINKHNPKDIFTAPNSDNLTLNQLNDVYKFFIANLEAEEDLYLENVINDLSEAYYILWKKITNAKFTEHDEVIYEEVNKSYFHYVLFPFKLFFLFIIRILMICVYIICIGLICYMAYLGARKYFGFKGLNLGSNSSF